MFLHRFLSLLFPGSLTAKVFFIVLATINGPLLGYFIWMTTLGAALPGGEVYTVFLFAAGFCAAVLTTGAIHTLIAPLRQLERDLERYETEGKLPERKVAGRDDISRLVAITQRISRVLSGKPYGSYAPEALDDKTGVLNKDGLLKALDTHDPGASGVAVYNLSNFAEASTRLEGGGATRLLADAAKVLRTGTRGGDLVCRSGATEFTVVLPGIEEKVLQASASRLVARITDKGHESGIRLAVSVGLTRRYVGEDWIAAIGRAEAAKGQPQDATMARINFVA